MSKYKEKMGDILNKIKGNKRILYLIFCMVLVLFCLALNVTFSYLVKNKSINGTNITIGNMNYIFAVNSEFEDLKSDIYNDRIIRVKASTTQRYYVSITAQNKYASKYELNYKVCASYDKKTNTCTYADSLPKGVKIAYSYDTPNPVEGEIGATDTKIITIYTNNSTLEDAYLELTMNAGYIHNELKTLGAGYNLIEDEFKNPDSAQVEIQTTIAYTNGEEVESYDFPSNGNFVLRLTCYDKNGDESNVTKADGYWNGTRWEVNVTKAIGNTICKARFNETDSPIPAFQYLVNGEDKSRDEAYVKITDEGDGNWFIKFLQSGTFKMIDPATYNLDIFLVGGGGAGAWNYGFSSGGGGGGYVKSFTYTAAKDTEYAAVIGAGGKSVSGSAGGTGGTTSIFGTSAAGGKGGGFSFNNSGDYGNGSGGDGGSGGGTGGWNQLDSGKNGGTNGGNGGQAGGDNAKGIAGKGAGVSTIPWGNETKYGRYAGGGGGGSAKTWGGGYVGGTGGAGGGGNGGKGDNDPGSPSGGYSASSGTANTGGGGGGAGWGASYWKYSGGNGGSGIIIIRNHQA